jgi:hypothetical protein
MILERPFVFLENRNRFFNRKTIARGAIATDRGFSSKERVDNRFFGCFYGCIEEVG